MRQFEITLAISREYRPADTRITFSEWPILRVYPGPAHLTSCGISQRSQAFSTPAWDAILKGYLQRAGKLQEKYAKERAMKRILVALPGQA